MFFKKHKKTRKTPTLDSLGILQEPARTSVPPPADQAPGAATGAPEADGAGTETEAAVAAAASPSLAPPAASRSEAPPQQRALAAPNSHPIYTRCPDCKTVYRVSVSELREGLGEMLCQNCQQFFNALTALSETVKNAVADDTPPYLPPTLGPLQAVASSRFERELATHPRELPADPSSRPSPTAWLEAERVHPRASVPMRIAWGLGTGALAGTLILQLGFFEGQRLSGNEQLRPWLEQACAQFDCSLPEFRDVSQIRIVDRALQPAHNGIDGYEFRLLLSNQSSLPQAFPAINLVLAEFDGKAVASRVFQPKEYLNQQHPGLMPVGQPLEIRLLLAKPAGREIGGFNFELI